MSLDSIFRLSLVMNMIDNLTGPMARVSSSVGGSVSQIESMSQTLTTTAKAGTAMTTLGQQIAKSTLAPVEATFATRRAIGELASLGVSDFEAIESAALRFSDTWAGTTASQFITAAYDIKSGVSSLSDQGIADFTEMAGLTARATKATVGQMTSLFATGYGIYKDYYDSLSDLEFAEMFSAGISESVRAFKTSGSGMAEAISSLGASATGAQVPLEEQLAVLGMLQATMSGSEAGTKYNAFLRSAAKAGDELGISFMDANNRLLSLPEILGRLRGKFGEAIDAAEKMELQKAFGDVQSVQFIDLLYGKCDELQSGILGLYSTMGEGRAVAERMATAINQTEPERYALLKQRIGNISASIGSTLLPTINELLGKAEDMLTVFAGWAANNQGIVKGALLAATAFGGFLTVGGAAITAMSGAGLILDKSFGAIRGLRTVAKDIPDAFQTIQLYALYAGDGIKKGLGVIQSAGAPALTAVKALGTGIFGMARQAISAAVTALPGLISSVWGFTAALLANPITWVVIGIVALIAAVYLLWTKCEWFREGVLGIWEGIKGGINDFLAWMGGIPAWFGDLGRGMIDSLAGGIMSSISKPVDAVKGALGHIRDMLPFSDAKVGPLSTLTLSGRRTMTTFAEGIEAAGEAPARAAQSGFARLDLSAPQVKKLSFHDSAQSREREAPATAQDRSVTIQKLLLNVDLKSIKDLQALMKLAREIEGYADSYAYEPIPEGV